MPSVSIANGRKITTFEDGTVIDEIYTPVDATPAPRQWSVGAFLSLLTPEEFDAAETLANTDKVAKRFWSILLQSDYVQENDERLDQGLMYFRVNNVTARTKQEILGA